MAPYFLFTGRLIDRIYNYVDTVAARHKDITFFKAKYLADQDHVLNTFEERIKEAETGVYADDRDLMLSFKKRLKEGTVSVHHHHAEYKPILDPEDDEVTVLNDHSREISTITFHSRSQPFPRSQPFASWILQAYWPPQRTQNYD